MSQVVITRIFTQILLFVVAFPSASWRIRERLERCVSLRPFPSPPPFLMIASGSTTHAAITLLRLKANKEDDDGSDIAGRARTALQEINSGAHYQESFRMQIDF